MVTNTHIRILLESVKSLAPILNDTEYLALMTVLKSAVGRCEKEEGTN